MIGRLEKGSRNWLVWPIKSCVSFKFIQGGKGLWSTLGKHFLSIALLSYFSIYLGENYNWTLLEVRISQGIFLEETKENTRSRTMGDILLVSSFLAFRCLTWYRIKTNRAGSFEPFILGKTLWLLRDMTINRILWQNQIVKNEILGQKLVDVIGKIPKVPVNIGRSAHFITKSASVSTLSTFCIVAFQCCFP